MTAMRTQLMMALAMAAATGAELLTIRVYNEAAVPDPALHRAVETLRHTFRVAGIQTRVLDCLRMASDVCSRPDPKAIELTVAGSAPAQERASFTLGTAMLPNDGCRPVYAKVMWNRVQRYAKLADAPAARVLGYAMAHEAGHLLLEDGAHAHAGVMKAVWNPRDAVTLTAGRLEFRGSEAAALRRGLAQRR